MRIELPLFQLKEPGGGGDDAELGHVVAVADGGLGVVRLGQRMFLLVAIKIELLRVGTEHVEHGVRAAGNGGDNAFHVIGKPGGNLGVWLERLEESFGAAGEKLFAGVEDEVLRSSILKGRELGAIDVEDLDGHAAHRRKLGVVRVLARGRGQPDDDGMFRPGLEETLCKLGRQLVADNQLPLQQTMRFGMGDAHGLAVLLT